MTGYASLHVAKTHVAQMNARRSSTGDGADPAAQGYASAAAAAASAPVESGARPPRKTGPSAERNDVLAIKQRMEHERKLRLETARRHKKILRRKKDLQLMEENERRRALQERHVRLRQASEHISGSGVSASRTSKKPPSHAAPRSHHGPVPMPSATGRAHHQSDVASLAGRFSHADLRIDETQSHAIARPLPSVSGRTIFSEQAFETMSFADSAAQFREEAMRIRDWYSMLDQKELHDFALAASPNDSQTPISQSQLDNRAENPPALQQVGPSASTPDTVHENTQGTSAPAGGLEVPESDWKAQLDPSNLEDSLDFGLETIQESSSPSSGIPAHTRSPRRRTGQAVQAAPKPFPDQHSVQQGPQSDQVAGSSCMEASKRVQESSHVDLRMEQRPGLSQPVRKEAKPQADVMFEYCASQKAPGPPTQPPRHARRPGGPQKSSSATLQNRKRWGGGRESKEQRRRREAYERRKRYAKEVLPNVPVVSKPSTAEDDLDDRTSAHLQPAQDVGQANTSFGHAPPTSHRRLQGSGPCAAPTQTQARGAPRRPGPPEPSLGLTLKEEELKASLQRLDLELNRRRRRWNTPSDDWMRSQQTSQQLPLQQSSQQLPLQQSSQQISHQASQQHVQRLTQQPSHSTCTETFPQLRENAPPKEQLCPALPAVFTKEKNGPHGATMAHHEPARPPTSHGHYLPGRPRKDGVIKLHNPGLL